MAKKPQTTFSTKDVKTRRRPQRPPRLRSFPAFPTGPRIYRVDEKSSRVNDFSLPPPPGFLTFTNSRTEWIIYLALAKVLGVPRNPRRGPFIGYPGVWAYQSPFEGGRAARGGQIVDFVVHGPGSQNGDIAIRLQTERYHLFTDSSKHAQDEQLRLRLASYNRTVDIYEQDVLFDPSGQSACIRVKQAIFGGSAQSPLKGGSARKFRA